MLAQTGVEGWDAELRDSIAAIPPTIYNAVGMRIVNSPPFKGGSRIFSHWAAVIWALSFHTAEL